MLNSWIEGNRKDVNWKTFVFALRDRAQLNSLADDIVSALQVTSNGLSGG